MCRPPGAVSVSVVASVGAGRGPDDDLAGVHIAGLFDGEADRAGDGVRADGHPAERLHFLAPLLVGDALGQFRCGHARADRADADVRVLLAQAFGEGPDRVPGGAIHGGGGRYRMGADGGDVHHVARALRLHRRQHGGDAVQHAADVDVDHAVPFVHPQRGHRGQRHHAGIVDDHVDASETFERMGGEGLDVRAARHVQRPGLGDAAARRDVGHDALEPVGAAGAQQHRGAAVREQPRRGFADAAAGAGDEDDFGEWVVLHGKFLGSLQVEGGKEPLAALHGI